MTNTDTHFEPIPDGMNANIVLASWLTDNLHRKVVLITHIDDPNGWNIEFIV
jgi:hypothetical protein